MTLAIEEHVDAFAGAQPRRVGPEPRERGREWRPGAGRIDHDARGAHADLTADAIAVAHSVRAAVFAAQHLFDRGVNAQLGAALERVARIGHAQPHAVDAPLVEGHATLRWHQPRLEPLHIARRKARVGLPAFRGWYLSYSVKKPS